MIVIIITKEGRVGQRAKPTLLRVIPVLQEEKYVIIK